MRRYVVKRQPEAAHHAVAPLHVLECGGVRRTHSPDSEFGKERGGGGYSGWLRLQPTMTGVQAGRLGYTDLEKGAV